MKRACLVAVLFACACGGGRVETQSSEPSFRASALAVAATRGAGVKGAEVARTLVRRLQAGGMKASSLEDSDSVVAGADLSLDIAADPSALAEVRRATGADGIVFLTLAPQWRSLDVAVLDASTGDLVLRATAKPRGEAFDSADEAAAAAAGALSRLAADRPKAAAAAGEKADEIPVPDVGGGD